jgi:glycosyltransferase involved in cell wall biosynthesis
MYKFVFVTSYYGDVTNGPGRFAEYYVQETLNNKEINISVISTDAANSLYGEKLFYVPKSKYILSRFVESFRIKNVLKKISEDGEIDAVYYNAPALAYFSLKNVKNFINFNDYQNAVHLSDSRIVDVGLKEYLYRKFWRAIEKRICKKNNVLLFNSKYTASVISKSYSLVGGNSYVTYKAVDLNKFYCKERKTFGEPIKIAFIGTDYKRKGLFVVLKAIKNLLNSGISVSLIISGNYKSELHKINSKISELNIEDSVEINGGSSKKRTEEILCQSDFLVLPSKMEALGVVIIEALACGAVVIASDRGGIPEIISNGKSGFLVSDSDDSEITRIISNLISDVDGYLKVQAEGYQRSRDFSVDKVINTINSIIIKELYCE